MLFTGERLQLRNTNVSGTKYFFSKGQIDICSSFKDVIVLSVLDVFENCLFCAINDPAQALPLQRPTEGTQNQGRREYQKNRGAQPQFQVAALFAFVHCVHSLSIILKGVFVFNFF